MPFLPSEAEETKLLINQQMKDVLVFHYLPILWYRHPIPNDVREFWYYQRPDILEYMQTAYKFLDIQLLPNAIIQELNKNPEFAINILAENNFPNIEKFKNQIAEEVLKETIKPIKADQLFINILSLNIFPFIAAPLFKGFLNLSNEDYQLMLENRKTEVAEFIINAIKV